MSRVLLSSSLIAIISAGATAGPRGTNPDGAQDPPAISGETVDPAGYGPGIIEPMSVVIERDRLRREADAERADAGKDGDEVHGAWAIPTRRSTRFPHSGERTVINKFGDTSMGIGFGRTVDVNGAYFARQLNREVTTTGLVVIGYRDGREVARTDAFRNIDDTPDWFAMDLPGVDRIVFVAEAVIGGAGWYAMDDFTYTIPATPDAEAKKVVLDFEDTTFRDILTGTDYAGLVWEEGTGEFTKGFGIDDPVHAPVRSPDEMRDDEEAGEHDVPGPDGDGAGGTPPLPILDFGGVIRGDAGSFSYPPDTHGAIGPSHYVETVNRNFAVYSAADGAELSNVLLGSFLPGSNGDPRVLWDHHSGRWFVIVSDFSATASIYLAVSMTSDPMGSWFKTSFVTASGDDAGCWPDYPTIGLDADGIYTASYMVGCAATIFTIEKAPLVAPAPSLGTITAFRGLTLEGAIQPAFTYGDSGGVYFVSRRNGSEIRLRQLSGPITSPSLVELGDVPVPAHSGPPDVPSLGSNTPLDHTVSHRMLNAVYRDGSIWACHDVNIDGRSAVRWYEMDPVTLSTVQVGTISDPSLHYFYGSIAVNAAGDVGLGFSGSNADQYAGCYFTGRLADDPPGETGPPALYKAGAAAQNNIDGFGRNRWGDYSMTTVDPNDDTTFWTIQEYAHGVDLWGTWILQMRPEIPPLVFSYPDGRPDLVDPQGDTVRVVVAGQDGGMLDPASPTLHFNTGGGFQIAPMIPISASEYDAVFPAAPCGSEITWYVSAQTIGGDTVTDPSTAPSFTFESRYGLGIAVTFADDFEGDTGWVTQIDGATSGEWQRGVPVNDPDWEHDPVSDSDGSGKCYLTQNELGNTDVDNGSVRLTSAPLDLSLGNVAISYDYYLRLTNSDGTDSLRFEISEGGTPPWPALGFHAADGGLGWRHVEITQAEIEATGVTLTDDMRVRFRVNDGDAQSIVESGVDAFMITTLLCPADIPGDVDGDGDVDFEDLVAMLAAWGPCPAPPAECPADFSGDGSVGLSDLLALLSNWS